MLTRIAAQGLTDTFAAVALGAGVLAAIRRGIRAPLELRMLFAFGGLCLFFLLRGAAEILSHAQLLFAAALVACPLPVAGLVLTEGMLRRHAPWPLKATIVLGAAAIFVGLVVASGDRPMSSWGLGGYVTLSLLILTALLLARDRASLSNQENASIDGLMLAGAGMMLLSLTDFFASPVGMSGVGAAIVAFLVRANPTSRQGVRRALFELLVFAAAAALLAVGLGQALGIGTAAETIRLGVVALALLLATTAVLGAMHENAGYDEARRLRRALAASDTSSLSAFLESLAGQPLLSGMRLAEGAMLSDYNAEALAETMAARPVWTLQVLADPTARGAMRGRDELADLMARNEASHAILVSRHPVRIALLTMPEISMIGESETDLALFHKLAAVAAQEGV